MTGRLLVDGIDVYSAYGVSIRKGGLNALINFPSIKPVEVNDWHEENGEEVDLSEIKLESKAFDIHFILDRIRGKFNNFLLMLSNEPYHTFSIAGRSYNLRMVDNPNLTLFNEFGLFSISFVDDFPISEDYVYSSPSSTISVSNQNIYGLDGKSLSAYGVAVLKGSSEVRRWASVKLNQRTDVLVINGLIYDEGGEVKYNAKDVQLECLMKAGSTSEFWRNYNALLYDLTQPEERILYVDATGVDYPCYYKNCSTIEFFRDSGIWWRFTLNLRFTSSTINEGGGIYVEQYLIATESKHIVTTEDNYAIDINTDDNVNFGTSIVKKKVSELPVAGSIQGLKAFGVDDGNRSVQIPLQLAINEVNRIVSKRHVVMTEAEFANLPVKNEDVIYLIIEE